MSRNQQGQHFLLSADARDMSLMQIFRMTDEQAFDMFRKSRWPETDGNPVCPRCGNHHHYWISTRSQWRCKACNYSFSITSGTIFANRKLPLRVYIAAVALMSNCAKGMSALQLSRDLDIQYKHAWMLAHKIRETLQDSEETQLEGEIELDGAYTNHYIRPENKKEDRIDRRLAENQNPNKRCVLVMRQRGPQGANKSISVITLSENQDAVLKFAKKHIKEGSTLFADENTAYDVLHAHFNIQRVNHDIQYVGDNGESTNQAESLFARFRRMQMGQVHKMDNLYLHNYAGEIAYREDTRRLSNGRIFGDILGRCAQAPVSRDFCGYKQGNKRVAETLFI